TQCIGDGGGDGRAGVDGQRAADGAGPAAGVELEQSAVDGGPAGVAALPTQRQSAGAFLGHRASGGAFADSAADGECAGIDGERAVSGDGNGAGSHVQVIGAFESEVAGPGLGIVVEGDRAAGGVVERTAVDG